MKFTAIVSALAVVIGLVAAEGLKIEVTHSLECDRKTQNGDQISMHYKGTLAGSGTKFDASMFAPILRSKVPANRCLLPKATTEVSL